MGSSSPNVGMKIKKYVSCHHLVQGTSFWGLIIQGARILRVGFPTILPTSYIIQPINSSRIPQVETWPKNPKKHVRSSVASFLMLATNLDVLGWLKVTSRETITVVVIHGDLMGFIGFLRGSKWLVHFQAGGGYIILPYC